MKPDRLHGEFTQARSRCRVMAVASAGGHWVQLFRLRMAWDGCAVTYVTTGGTYRQVVMADAARRGQTPPRFFPVTGATRWQKLRLVVQALQLLAIIILVRPDVIVTTGAAPGFFAVRLGKLLRARTVWIDSIANAGELSLSGRKAGNHVDLWLTQWKHLARAVGAAGRGPEFHGSTL